MWKPTGSLGTGTMPEPSSHATLAGGLNPTGRLTGPNAAVWKYDLLTALSLFALGQGATVQTSILRLIAAVTARYDWRRDQMSIGRLELGRLWQCSEPTVKRELRRLRGLEILVQIRPGVRGRVAAYRLSRPMIEHLTARYWSLAGEDFAERMRTPQPAKTEVVTLPTVNRVAPLPGSLPRWAEAIAADDPVIFNNWFARVSCWFDGETAVFSVPSDFLARQIETRFLRQMQASARYAWPEVRNIRVEVVQDGNPDPMSDTEKRAKA